MTKRKILLDTHAPSLRLALTFGLLITGMIGVAALGIAHSYRDQSKTVQIQNKTNDERNAREVLTYSNINAQLLAEVFAAKRTSEVDTLLARRAENSQKISALIDKMAAAAEAPPERELVANIKQLRARYLAASRQALAVLREQNQPQQAHILMIESTMPALADYHNAVHQYISLQNQRILEINTAHDAQTRATRRETFWLTALVVVVAAGLAIFVAVNVSREISRRRRAEEVLRKTHEELEDTVQARTAQLLQANRQLQTEIASRQAVEEELRASEDRYRQIVETAEDMIYRLTPEGRVTFANAAAARMVGRSPEECRGMHFLSLTRKDFREAALEFYHRQLKDRTPVTYMELPLLTTDGRELWIGQNVQLIAESDQVVELQVVSRDVTRRQIVERQLLESEQRYRLLFESNPQPMWVFDTATREFLAVNDAAIEQYGYSREEFLSMTIEKIRPPDEVSALFTRQANVHRGLGSYDNNVRWRHRRKDGTLIDVEITWHLIDFDGRAAKLVLAQNVTERRRAEDERAKLAEEMEAQRQRLNDILTNIPCVVWEATIDPVTHEPTGLFVNSYVEKMHGYSAAEWLATPDVWFETLHPDDQKLIEARNAQLFTHGSVRNDLRWIHKDGRVIWGENQIALIKDDAGRPIGMRGITTDITERKQTEQALQESEDRYHRLVQLSPDGIIVHQQGQISFVNPAGLKLIGCDNESQVIGKSVFDLVLPEYCGLLRQRLEQMRDNEELPLAEVRGRRFDGLEIDCEVSSVLFRQQDHSSTLAVVRDITERKRAELALQEANQRALADYERLLERIAALGQHLANARDLNLIFRALREFSVASVPCDGMVISLYEKEKKTRRVTYAWVDGCEIDPTGVPDVPVANGLTGRAITTGSVVMDNDFLKHMGQKSPVVLGDCGGDHLPQSALTAPMTIMGRVIGGVEVQSYQLGAYRQEHATAMRMAASLAASAIENVTLIEREQAKEEQLRQALKMEAVGRLAGGVAHDFNNMLTAINGYSDLTLMSLEAGSPLAPKIQEIRKAGERAATLTRQLLAFSRKQMMQPRVIDLNTVISEMGTLLLRMIGEDIAVKIVLQPEIGQVKADPGQIEQVLMNLAVNSRDAMPTGGNVTIETRNAYVEHTLIKGQEVVRPGHYVVLSVTDDGCGMDAETQEKIFEPFFTTKGFGKGTGLGLSMVYGIIKQSEGNIWVYSEPGKGSTFKIYLPRVDQASREDAPEEIKAVMAGSETVLLVEDEQIVRDLSREVLERYGYQVICATDGEDGLRVCKEFDGRIDLMITDVVMPRMGGRELAEQLATVRPDTKVLYMSGFTDDAIVRHGLLEEHFAFIQKPFSPESLAQKAREVLDDPAHPAA